MSLRQSVIGTFGVTYDDGDPDERSGADPTACDDRPRGWSAHTSGGCYADEHWPAPGYPPAPVVRGGWPAGFGFRKRGRPSNRQHGETFHRTVVALVREHYPDFGPTLAAEKLIERHGLCVGVERRRPGRSLAPQSVLFVACRDTISHLPSIFPHTSVNRQSMRNRVPL